VVGFDVPHVVVRAVVEAPGLFLRLQHVEGSLGLTVQLVLTVHSPLAALQQCALSGAGLPLGQQCQVQFGCWRLLARYGDAVFLGAEWVNHNRIEGLRPALPEYLPRPLLAASLRLLVELAHSCEVCLDPLAALGVQPPLCGSYELRRE
jgi:hypothetical protein